MSVRGARTSAAIAEQQRKRNDNVIGDALFEAKRAGRQLEHVLEEPGAEQGSRAPTDENCAAPPLPAARAKLVAQLAVISHGSSVARVQPARPRAMCRSRRNKALQWPQRRVCSRSNRRASVIDVASQARVAELVDAHDSKSCSARSGGSIPSTGTTIVTTEQYEIAATALPSSGWASSRAVFSA